MWSLAIAVVLDLWVGATVRQINAGKHADILDTTGKQRETMRLWVKVDIGVVVVGILLAFYGHAVA
jgi:uncharacterized membrane protein YGL010W